MAAQAQDRSDDLLAGEARVNSGICTKAVNASVNGSAPNQSSLRHRAIPTWFKASKIGFFLRFGNANESSSREELERFNENINFWRPKSLVRALKSVGASYVVVAAKHMGSFALWPTQVPNTSNPGNESSQRVPSTLRDIVGEVTLSVREMGMEVGLYCGGDVATTFTEKTDWRVREMLYGQLHELINWYRPALLWNNYGWPGDFANKTKRLGWTFVDYFTAKCSKGVVNSRFWNQEQVRRKGSYTGDYTTVKYTESKSVPFRNFEYMSIFAGLSVAQASWRVAEVAGKGGSLMFEIGLNNDGSVPEKITKNLRGLGVWMSFNADAIKGTRPFLEGGKQMQRHVRLTYRKEDQRAFAIIRQEAFNWNRSILIDHPALQDPSLDAELLTPLGPELITWLPGGRWQLSFDAVKPPDGMPLVLAFRPQVRFLQPWPERAPQPVNKSL